jgi:hypothetical protein
MVRVKRKKPECSSNVTLSGVNGDVIMSGHEKHHSSDDEGTETSRSHPESLSRRDEDGRGGAGIGVTERQSYRIKAKIGEEGVRGVIHGNRGRPCSWKVSQKTERKIVELAKYSGNIPGRVGDRRNHL